MNRVRWICMILCAILAISCLPTRIFDGKIAKSLHKEIRKKGKTEIDLDKVIPFDWDELYLFDPYTSRFKVCETVGIEASTCGKEIRIESSDDGVMLIVAKLDGKVIHQEEYSRYNGDFTPVNYPQPLLPNNSKFIAVVSSETVLGMPWITLNRLESQEANYKGQK